MYPQDTLKVTNLSLFNTIGPDGKITNPFAKPAETSSAVGTGGTFGPGQAARFTPDPTVAGYWTHTDASVPLFKNPPPAPAPATPATASPAPGKTSSAPKPPAQASSAPAAPSNPYSGFYGAPAQLAPLTRVASAARQRGQPSGPLSFRDLLVRRLMQDDDQ